MENNLDIILGLAVVVGILAGLEGHRWATRYRRQRELDDACQELGHDWIACSGGIECNRCKSFNEYIY